MQGQYNLQLQSLQGEQFKFLILISVFLLVGPSLEFQVKSLS